MGKCSGILSGVKIIPIPNQPKGKPDAKLITKEGLVTDASFIITTENWNCKNWSIK